MHDLLAIELRSQSLLPVTAENKKLAGKPIHRLPQHDSQPSEQIRSMNLVNPAAINQMVNLLVSIILCTYSAVPQWLQTTKYMACNIVVIYSDSGIAAKRRMEGREEGVQKTR